MLPYHASTLSSLSFLTLLTALCLICRMLADLITNDLSRESLSLSFLSFTCYYQASSKPDFMLRAMRGS